MRAFLVTVGCIFDDVVVGIRISRIGAELRQRQVLDAIARDPNWLRDNYGFLSRDDPARKSMSEPICVRILTVHNDLTQIVSSVSVDYSEKGKAS